MPPQYDVLVAGHICLDLIPALPPAAPGRIQDLIVPGKLIHAGALTISTGGPVSNTGLALRRLGLSVRLAAKIGDDPVGREVLRRLGAGEGVRPVPGEQTAYTIVIAPPGLDRCFLHHPGANDTFGAGGIDYDLAAGARVFHLGYPPVMRRLWEDGGEQLVEIFRRVKGLGVTTSLDMALPDAGGPSGQVDWDALCRSVLPHVDLFLPSAEELLYMLDRERFAELTAGAGGRELLDVIEAADVRRTAERALSYGPAVVGVKCGRKGMYLRTAGRERLASMGVCPPADPDNWADRELWEAAFRVERVASATGSGDSCIAGFLAAYVRGGTAERTLRFACAVGACNVTAVDALSGIRTADETQARIDAGWAKAPLALPGADWRPAAVPGLHLGRNDRAFA